MNYTNIIVKGMFVCLLVLAVQVVFVAGADAATQCSGGSCWFTACNSNSDCGTDHFVASTYSCQGNNFYQEYITNQCNNPGTQNASCSSTKSPKLVQTCSQKCEVGLWYNGCTTSNTTGGGTGSGTGNNPSCTQNASKQCVSNIAYWYDSCENIQSVYQNCNTTNQACQNGQCVNTTPTPTYVRQVAKTCYQKNVYWYDSKGYVTDIYKNCSDINSCTADSCSAASCKNTLKCDGSTCATNSADYQAYCSGNNGNTGTGTSGSTVTGTGTSGQNQGALVTVSVFASKESSPAQLSKNITAANGEKVYFAVTIKNASTQPVENVSVTTDFAGNVTYGNDLKIDDLVVGGNITSGINLGTLAPNTSKAMSFSGTVQSLTTQAFQVSSRVTANNVSDSDFLTITVGSAGGAAVSESGASNAIWEFIKRWYIWIIILMVLAVLFVIIFRRLSDNNA